MPPGSNRSCVNPVKVLALLLLLSTCVHLFIADTRGSADAWSPNTPADLERPKTDDQQTLILTNEDGGKRPNPQKIATTKAPPPRETNRDWSVSGSTGLDELEGRQTNDDEIYLENIDDLDHLSYLAMRNYNLTDDALLQSSWLVGNPLGSALNSHKQHIHDDPTSGSATSSDQKNRLALMLEALVLQLRNGHLRRLSVEELLMIVNAQNLTDSFESMQERSQSPTFESARLRQPNLGLNDVYGADESRHQDGLGRGPVGGMRETKQSKGESSGSDGNEESRCFLLVTLYKYELAERVRSQTGTGGPMMAAAGSKVEYENVMQSKSSLGAEIGPVRSDENSNRTSSVEKRFANPNSTTSTNSVVSEPATDQPLVDENRLLKLCKLAVECRSSDELVNLISKPWKLGDPQHKAEGRKQTGSGTSMSKARDHLEREFMDHERGESEVGFSEGNTNSPKEVQRLEENNLRLRHRQRSIRDSVSLSLAKLCPLILFPLHEDDGQCMVRRDDRPPMITVWAFAFLFVTIVCFCSLIGLSITPLLGSSTADSSTTGDSDTSGPAVFRYLPNFLFGSRQNGSYDASSHKASLTLFEGLAVGSLVGSGLFSLIPQAFELQERESNQSFLLKAFIIFSGIYLFFLSERIMRIILDTRQKRKREKRLNHRSSTTAAAEVPTETHQHLLAMPQPGQQYFRASTANQHSQGSEMTTATSSMRQNSLGYSRPSTSSRGSAGKLQSARAVSSVTGSRQPDTFEPIKPDNKSKAVSALTKERSKALKGLLDKPNKKPNADTNTALVAPQLNQHRQAEEVKSEDRRVKDRKNLSSNPKRAKQTGQKKNRPNRKTRKTSAVSWNSTQHPNQGRNQREEQRPKKQSQRSSRAGREQSKHPTNKAPARGHRRRTRDARSSSAEPSYTSDSSTSSSSSSPSFTHHTNSRYAVPYPKNNTRLFGADYSQNDYSSSESALSLCSSCSSFGHEFCRMVSPNHSDSDDDNDQRRAVSKRMNELSYRSVVTKHRDQSHHDQQQVASLNPRTTFEFDPMDPHSLMRRAHAERISPVYLNSAGHYATDRKYSNGQQTKQRDISTVAWMIILGDGLHNFIDGISIGAAFSESILSGVSISVAVICEEFPHELGDFAVLVSSGMTIRQALGYNFLSACTCYLGMAVGIILGDVTNGASYISALAAGVFLYIALVDMMGELSAALEASSRESIAKTLKLFFLQNVGIAIGISIIFVLSFIDF